jgi:crossover junction endodeoxyribonuclease RuvC
MPFSVRPQHSMSPHQRYLGIDPGLNRTGYALLERTSAGPILLEGGIIQSTTSSTLHERVHEIGTGVREVLDELQPGVVAIEQVFSHRQNLRTALVLAQARGAILMCVVDTGIPVIHYSPTEIKRLLTGNGRAPKTQIQQVIQRELRLDQLPEPHDVADASAVALCLYHSVRIAA